MPADTSPPGEPTKRAYRLGKRRASIDRTRQSILEAATDLFAGAAPARISLEDVAAKAGVSRATVYYQFKSRRELLDALVLAALPIPAMAELVLAREHPDARDAARAYVHGMAYIWEACGPAVANVSALAAVDTEARQLANDYDEQRRQALIGLAGRLSEQRYLRSGVTAGLAAEVMWWLTGIATFHHLRERSGLTIDAVAHTLVAMLDPLIREERAP